LLALAAALLAILAFCYGFTQPAGPIESVKYGAIIGVGSAVSWAVASTFGNSFLRERNSDGDAILNNWLNLFAAVFAALSLGFVTSADSICYVNSRPNGLVLASNNLFFAIPCYFRPPWPRPAVQIEPGARR
jgi:drug/metabolite transporter (DMT)-like permease